MQSSEELLKTIYLYKVYGINRVYYGKFEKQRTDKLSCHFSFTHVDNADGPFSSDGGNQRQFSENISSEDDLRSRIFGTFAVKFLACLPLLGISNI